MKHININDKLLELGVDPATVPMGDFDYIGEFTAKRDRAPGTENYNKFGAFYRSNYERGILIYYLIRKHGLTSMLEIGFGRGYATFCAARAFHDAGVQGEIITVDPAFDEKFLQALSQVLHKEWFKYVKFIKGTSQQVLQQFDNRKFDLIYIDGDHSYEGTKHDWEWSKERYTKFCLFDDYHLPSKDDPGIDCARLIDEIEDPTKELILMDRRMFFDDRRVEKLDYGQVLLTGPEVEDDEW
jgi:hypothetical protein